MVTPAGKGRCRHENGTTSAWTNNLTTKREESVCKSLLSFHGLPTVVLIFSYLFFFFSAVPEAQYPVPLYPLAQRRKLEYITSAEYHQAVDLLHNTCKPDAHTGHTYPSEVSPWRGNSDTVLE